MLFMAEGGKPENPEKNRRSKARTNNKLSPHMTLGEGLEPELHWWEPSVLTTVLTLIPVIPAITIAFCFQALRVLLFGTPYTTFNSDWRKQHINFFSNMSYALSFFKVICDHSLCCFADKSHHSLA